MYTGGWKSVFYSLHIAQEVGWGAFWESLRSKNTCKTCAYGMGGQQGGMVNEAGNKIEVCKKSMQAQLTDIQPPIPDSFFRNHAISDIASMRPRDIERLGRLNFPLYKAPGDKHYRPITWEEAMQRTIEKYKATNPDRTFFYSSGRSSNEAAFLLHLFARLYGTNHVNNCSYYCHQASGVGLATTVGTGTATVDLTDVKKADVVFVIGANPASNHPRFLTELMHVRRRGGQVVVVNPAKEPGMVRFSIPSDMRSLLSAGSDIASLYLQPRVGGDLALCKGIAKYLLEQNAIDQPWIDSYTEGFSAFRNDIEATDWKTIVDQSGVSKDEIAQAAMIYMGGQNVIFAWAMGITHHIHGVENVEAIANLSMLRGMIGRPYAGLLPLRGHSNVQGVGSVGVSPELKKSIFTNIQDKLGVVLPQTEGWDTMRCMHEATQGNVDIAFLLGGNLYGSNPNLGFAEVALNRVPFKVYVSTTLNEGHVRGVEGETLVLPAIVRDEESQSTTQESMFSFVRLSDGGPTRMKGARSEVDILVELASAVVPAAVFDFRPFSQHRTIRKAIAATVPGFEKLDHIDDTLEEFHIEGRTIHAPHFQTQSGKAIFVTNPLPAFHVPPGSYRLMTVRSEGQFNTIIYDEDDAWRGQQERWIVMMNPTDMQQAGLKADQFVDLRSHAGEMKRVKVRPFDLSSGTLMGYYPEMNILVGSELDPRSKTPSFKHTVVTLHRVETR